ncbi:hypothetical protein DFQ01_12824 [Paenibacillus cellulosilyticus]|uniref:Uncharacterized protein n=1 Tax=Paenibacillus cellulosilyticus TaxID=375489 RepID=A0A2V2YW14_9BACL|nr:hypothetical protein DFQ01_12824 [Paenibacillus cellulosilyticus]
MPLWINWLMDHWIPTALVIGLLIAFVFVFTNRNSLFYKE